MSSSKDDPTTSLLASPQPSLTPRTPLIIHVYDLIPPGHLTNLLWNIGAGLVHSGIVLNGKEWAFGFHQKPGVTGVYHTESRTEPPGATFRDEILHGFTYRNADEIQDVIDEASRKFQGTSWHLLRNNCNHFTSFICERLTGTPAPSYLNRAASIGIALPCFVPEQWVDAPDAEVVDPVFIEHELDGDDEDVAMLKAQISSETHDSEPEYDIHEMSDSNETDDSLRAKWRRKRRKYRGSRSNGLETFDSRPFLQHRHLNCIHITHRGRRIRYRIRRHGHQLHIAIHERRTRHREDAGAERYDPYLLASIQEEREKEDSAQI